MYVSRFPLIANNAFCRTLSVVNVQWRAMARKISSLLAGVGNSAV
jgi:hypothetical protein